MCTTLSITSLNQGNIYNRKLVKSSLQADFDDAARQHAQAVETAPKASRPTFLTTALASLTNALHSTRLVHQVEN